MDEDIFSKNKTAKNTSKEVTPDKASAAPAPSTKPTKNPALAIGIIGLIVGAGGLGFSIYTYVNGTSKNQTITLAPGQDGNSVNFTEGSISDIVSKVSPSVVSIVTETRTSNWYGGTTTGTAAGTGFIVSSDGYIVTNKHVVEDANGITVVLEDGTTYDRVKLIGTDPLNDVAILKINAENLTPVVLGDSKTVSTGQNVIAIGNALGVFGNSVTSGVISGTGRSIVASDSNGEAYENLTDLIQTDAAINSGNSGGPLVNAAGQVIGINTATSGSGENIGFTIPISGVKGLINYAIKNGKLARPYIGVRYLTITPEIAKKYSLDATAGAYINGDDDEDAIISNSPAARADLKSGDIITAINGVKIGAAGSLGTLVGEYMPGDTIEVTYLRDGNYKTITLTLDEYIENHIF